MLHDRPEGSYENTSTLGSVAAHRGTDELLAEAVDHLVTYNDWFAHKVSSSIPAVERGDTVPDEDVRAWLEERERC